MKAAEKLRLEAQCMLMDRQRDVSKDIDWQKVDRYWKDKYRRARQQSQHSSSQKQEAYKSILGWRHVPCHLVILTSDDKAIGLAVEFCRWTVLTTLPELYTGDTVLDMTMDVADIPGSRTLYRRLLKMQ